MKNYILLLAVVIISFGLAFTLPTKEILQGIYASPGILALFGVLYQLIRDNAAHDRNLEIQLKQQIFNIGAASHMANVAFDKHVEFCEKYMREVHDTVTTLFSRGPTEDAINHATNFHNLRQEYSAWLTDEINEKLFPFEQALRSLGASEQFVKNTTGSKQHHEQRSKHMDKAFEDFKTILSIDEDKEHDPVIAVEAVKKKVRDILGIEELIQLRKHIIREATDAANT